MSEDFFEKPILNSPYDYPGRHWELDAEGLPTNRIIESRRVAEFITPVPKPKKRRRAKGQTELVLDSGHGLSTEQQEYDPTWLIGEVRSKVSQWRAIKDPAHWQVTPETV